MKSHDCHVTRALADVHALMEVAYKDIKSHKSNPLLVIQYIVVPQHDSVTRDIFQPECQSIVGRLVYRIRVPIVTVD